jgi:hypothetical protein
MLSRLLYLKNIEKEKKEGIGGRIPSAFQRIAHCGIDGNPSTGSEKHGCNPRRGPPEYPNPGSESHWLGISVAMHLCDEPILAFLAEFMQSQSDRLLRRRRPHGPEALDGQPCA